MMRRAATLLVGIALIAGAADAQQLRLWSDTISPEARAALAAEAARPPAGPSPEAQRAPIDAVQRDLGGRRLARYRVTMKEGAVGGLPVRI
ncbi:MAG: hypothetical protein JSS15_14785, partial [Proteobacteria bacterium]|nr:hypothetical protein [Pseudomonadota bacterium]